MKSIFKAGLFCLLALAMTANTLQAQFDSFSADLSKMLVVNGSAATTDGLYAQVVAQLKPAKPDVTESQWTALKLEVFDVEVAALNEQLIPIYKKFYTHEDVKAIIAFYETPVGKKMASVLPQLNLEQIRISQTWGMGLMGKIQAFLDKPVKAGPPIGIKSGE